MERYCSNRPKPTAGCSANGRRSRIYIYIYIYCLFVKHVGWVTGRRCQECYALWKCPNDVASYALVSRSVENTVDFNTNHEIFHRRCGSTM
jgi:hypothetical protein